MVESLVNIAGRLPVRKVDLLYGSARASGVKTCVTELTPDTSGLIRPRQKLSRENDLRSSLEGTRMVSSLTRNQVRRKPLRVRLPCPPL